MKKRAQGRPDARCTRGLVRNCAKKRTRAYRSSGEHPAFPARWFTAYNVLFPANGFLAAVAPGKLPGNLTPAPRCQNHTPSPSARPCVRLSQAPRPPHPTARVVTCATPLSSGETGRACNGDLPDALSEIFLIPGLDTNSENQKLVARRVDLSQPKTIVCRCARSEAIPGAGLERRLRAGRDRARPRSV